MSTPKDNETSATKPESQPTQAAVPDGTSELPSALPDFPPPTSGDQGGSGSTTGN
jgi:hypothetical protein